MILAKMNHINMRMGRNKFYDSEHFPEGFVESGLFTDAEEELLIYWGETMYGLETGDLIPENWEEEHFIQVIEKQNLATSPLEKVWLKYRRHARYYIVQENAQ